MAEQPLVCQGASAVELIDDYHVESIRLEPIQAHLRERLHGPKDMAPLVGHVASNIQLAELPVAQDLTKHVETLSQDFLPMGHEEKAGVGTERPLVAQPLV